MVYGWTFAWTPGDAARKVEDRFELTPVALIPPGSERLKSGRRPFMAMADRGVYGASCSHVTAL